MKSTRFSQLKGRKNKNQGLILFILFLSLYPYLTLNAGWSQLNSGTSRNLYSVFFVSPSTGWLSGEYGIIFKTTNGGINWLNQTNDTNNSNNSIYFVNTNTGYVAGYNSFFGVGIIQKTTNSGVSWFYQPVGSISDLSSIFFVDSLSGYASGWQRILKTTNGGATWILSYYQGYGDLRSVFFTSGLTGFCAGDGGRILKTANGGGTWDSLDFSPLFNIFTSVFFPNSSNGYAAGANCSPCTALLYRTTNAGINWFDTSPIGFLAIYSIYFTGINTGYTSGRNGQILKTTNAGNNWYSQNTPTGNNLNGIRFADLNTGYAVGTGGVILKTTDGGGPIGIVPISNEIPKEFHLGQNYPNPFNPSTKFKIDIPSDVKRQMSNVKVVVYDALGRVIEVLVNEQLRPGTYEVKWDASNYPSGVYLYTLISGEFRDTKRMVLVK